MTTKKKKITKSKESVREIEPEETDGEFWCWLDMKMKPFPVWRKDEILKQLRGWLSKCDITKGEGLRISQFYNSINLLERDYYRLVERYPEFKDAHEQVMEGIAERRETGALLGQLNPNVVMRYQPIWDRRVTKMMEWQAQLAKTEEQKGMNLTVVLPKAEETDMVPPKKKAD